MAMRLMLVASMLAACAHSPPPPATRDREVESLEQAVRWPDASTSTVMLLANAWLSTHRYAEGYAYFDALAPRRPLFEALAGLFQARSADGVPLLRRVAWVDEAIGKLDRAASRDPLSRYLRGVVFLALPQRFGKRAQGVADMEWALKNAARFPPGLERGAREALAGRSGFLSDSSVSAKDGFRFVPPQVREPARGVYVARGYDFADLAFVATSEGFVAIDAGTTPASAARALAAVRAHDDLPIRKVIVTHAHWDHIGGLSALAGPGVEVIARSNFRGELARVNASPAPFHFFFGDAAEKGYSLAPQRTIEKPETLVVGDTRFELIPTAGGETDDALLVRLPERQITFVGDAFMPYFGAPFVAEGSVDGLLATVAQLRALGPTRLIHGHAPLTDNFTFAVLQPLAAALTVVRDAALRSIHDGRPLADALGSNLLPEVLRDAPDAVVPFLLMRDNAVQRIYAQHSGYWQADGAGMAVFSERDWAAALDLFGADAVVRVARSLNDRGDYAMALRLAAPGQRSSPALAAERLRALEGLRARYQFNPFRLIVYSDLANEELH